MIRAVNHRYRTFNNSADTSFLLANIGQRVTHKFDLLFDYNFNSTIQSPMIVTAQNEVTWLNGDFSPNGILVGDVIDIDAEVSGGSNINVTATVLEVNNGTIKFTTNVFNSNKVNEQFPLQDNQEMFFVNTSRAVPEELIFFYNLIENSATSGVAGSLFDSNVNQFKVTVPTVDGVNNIIQLGDKSGGSFFNGTLEKSGSTYTVELTFLNWLDFVQPNFDRPDEFEQQNTVKPYINFKGYSQANNPNGVLNGEFISQFGNVGWLNENYNQGLKPFTVESVVFKDANGDVIGTLDHNQQCTIEVEVKANSGTIADYFELQLVNILPNSITKNNADIHLDNTLKTVIQYDGVTPIISQGNRQGAQLTAGFVGANATGDTLTFVAEYTPNAAFTQLIEGINSTDRLFRISVCVENTGGTANTKNNVALLLHQGGYEKAPIPSTPYDKVDRSVFIAHNETLSDLGSSNYQGCTEDDFLYHSKFRLNKNETIQGFQMSVDVIRTSDNVRIARLQESFFDFASAVFLNGKYLLNFEQQLTQFLDSQDRNKISLKVTGNETSNDYEVEFIASLMANWRTWLSLPNLLPDFYDINEPNNGQNAAWVNYLRLAGYQIRLTCNLIFDGFGRNWSRTITLKDYDESTNITSVISFLDENNDPVTALFENQIIKVVAEHTKLSGDFNQGNVWGFLRHRPKNSETSKLISTSYDWTNQNAPLQPLPNETRALLTFPSANVAKVEAQINSSLAAVMNTFVARIEERGCDSLLDMVFQEIKSLSEGEKIAALTDILIVGSSYNKPNNFCCPKCEEAPIYYIGNPSSSANISELTGEVAFCCFDNVNL